jgi:hypothetical protein
VLRAAIFTASVGLLSLFLHLVFSRSKEGSPVDHPEFSFPKGLCIFTWIGASAATLLFTSVIFDSAKYGSSSVLITGTMSVVGITVGAWSERYVLKLWGDHLTCGAFRTACIDYKDIVSAETRSGGRGLNLYIKTSKKTMIISGSLSSFPEATRILKSKLDGVR